MKLASLKDGTRDGALAVVSRGLDRAVRAGPAAPTLQYALDHWTRVEPELRDLARRLEEGRAEGAEPFDPAAAMAPLPRAYQWADFSSYVTHVELVRRARGATLPDSFWNDPLVYQGAGDCNLGPTDPIPMMDPGWGLDFEGEVAAIVDDVPAGTDEQAAGRHIRLLMLVNDVTLRDLVPGELAKGFGFFQSKPQTAFSPVAVTPDELGDAWDGDRIHLPLLVRRGAEPFGRPNAGRDMVFGFRRMVAHVARTRPLAAGAIIGSGTVSNADRGVGSACIAERRAREMVEHGAPRTPFLAAGERVRIEMLDREGRSVFGAIDQVVTPVRPPQADPRSDRQSD
ncbi:fumarylacetoacetate hydrolase family protein [Arenibaculum sp.]|uniref:fumarylacetoacetate hydrolase family protein n=1 Tax=Arenibaculum sp. TaxID=2865862 RepID=UPI002E0E6056|nr:fumarylacetoacetate hydrolase family protein [Arenibaculum sp.]